MTLGEFITTYWSQITVFTFGVGFFLKSLWNFVIKKREINFNLFQQRKLDSVNCFYSTYAKTEQMWKGISIYPILNNKIKAEEIDKIIFPLIDELQRIVLELQIYFDDKQHNYFERIFNNVQMINKKLMQIYLDESQNLTTIKKANEFVLFRDKKLLENKPIFKEISSVLKESFK
jgi:hypothetical protein